MSITHWPQADPVPGDAASAVRAATRLIAQLTVDSATNLALLCRHHHTVVHRHHYTAHTTPHGVTWNL